MKKLLSEFKQFALQGNVVNLAVGMMIALAFQAVVASFIADLLTPLIGLFSRDGFEGLVLQVGGATLHYGAFLTAVLHFFIMAFVVFCLVRVMNRLYTRKEEAKKPARTCSFCITEIAEKATRCHACTSHIE